MTVNLKEKKMQNILDKVNDCVTVNCSAEFKRLPNMKSIKEMVELTGLSYSFLRQLCMQNKIVHIRSGKKYLINYDRFIDYLNIGECS